MKISAKPRPLLRRLHRFQTVAGVATLALAIPYSGCFTARVWNSDTVLIASAIEGRTDFIGEYDRVYENAAGDLAYPGTMHFVSDAGDKTEETGWLIVPAQDRQSWSSAINGYEIHGHLSHRGPRSLIEVNPPPRVQSLGWAYHSVPKFPEAKAFPFYAEGSGFTLEHHGYQPVAWADATPSPAADSDRVVSPAAPALKKVPSFILRYNPVVRTTGSDALNVASKVALTPVAIAGDALTGAGFVAGGVVILAGAIIYAPIKAVGSLLPDTPKKVDAESPNEAGQPPENREPRGIPDAVERP